MPIEVERIQRLNAISCDPRGRYVLYWMQQSQRAEHNPALEYALSRANTLGQGLVVGFGLTDAYPEANARHYAFMLEGLAETAKQLHRRGIKFIVRRGSPESVALELAKQASLVVCDRGYLRHQRTWRKRVAENAEKEVVQIEGDTVVPIECASHRPEYAARTLRPKLRKQWDKFLSQLSLVKALKSSLPLTISTDLESGDWQALFHKLRIDRSVGPVTRFQGGTRRARKQLAAFLRSGLDGYHGARNDPAKPQCSNLSPYLHFGQISPVEVALKVRAASRCSQEDVSAYLEELVIRRELAINFVYYTANYDSYRSLPQWARDTLSQHRDDQRTHRYTRPQLETAETHDPYWNAAMTEMAKTGYMHNYMRMYWGKKIIEWCNTPEYAYSTALYLNNKYFLDGRDANSYTNIAWLFGLHDRAWTERKVFGKVRYMNAAGLQRKFNIDNYVKWTETL